MLIVYKLDFLFENPAPISLLMSLIDKARVLSLPKKKGWR